MSPLPQQFLALWIFAESKHFPQTRPAIAFLRVKRVSNSGLTPFWPSPGPFSISLVPFDHLKSEYSYDNFIDWKWIFVTAGQHLLYRSSTAVYSSTDGSGLGWVLVGLGRVGLGLGVNSYADSPARVPLAKVTASSAWARRLLLTMWARRLLLTMYALVRLLGAGICTSAQTSCDGRREGM